MKKIIEVEDLCCKRCAERAEKKLMLLDGVSGARANYKKNVVLVETTLPDSVLSKAMELAGFIVKSIQPRKGIFA